MDINIEVSDLWLASGKPGHNTRPWTASLIEDNIGGIVHTAWRRTSVSEVLTTDPVMRVRRDDRPRLWGESDILITVLAPWPAGLDDEALRRYMVSVMHETTIGIEYLLSFDQPRVTVQVRLVKECAMTIAPGGAVHA